MKTEHKIYSITLIIFVIIFVLGVIKKANAKPKVIAVQNNSDCEIVLGKSVNGQLKAKSVIQPGAYWTIRNEKVTAFCE